MIKYKIQTRKGNEAILEGRSQIQVTEQARQFCQSKGEGWPGCVKVWERIEDKPKSGGKKS